MKLTVMLLCLWSACACAVDPDPENLPFHVKDVIAGPNLEAVLTALPELARHNLDYRKYRISVATEGDQLVVIFSDLQRALGLPSDTPTLAAIAIEVSSDGKTVTGFKWQR